MKVIHFDCYPEDKKYQKKENHVYIAQNIQSYLKEYGDFDADIVTGFVFSRFDCKILKNIKNLKLLITRSIGKDNIDKNYCKSNGIKYTNIQYSNHNVAHHTLALILFNSRKLETNFSRIKRGIFSDIGVECVDLQNKKFGVIGYGRIGKEVVKLAQNFDMEILVSERNSKKTRIVDGVNFCSIQDVFKNSDIISLHCDANPSTIGLINEKNIKLMKDGVVLINTARGSLIKEDDLIKNIPKFSFIGLDVLCDENAFTKKHKFLKYNNIFITPHIAYKSELTSRERWCKTYEYIDEFIAQQKS